VTAAAPLQGADLDSLLVGRLSRSLAGTPLGQRRATVLLDAGGSGVWSVDVEGGRGRARRGTSEAPTLTVRASADVLAQIVGGELSGVQAFLDGRVAVRGDLALALQLNGLFGGVTDPTAPRWKETTALGVRTAFLEAGPADAPPVVLLHGLGATNASMLTLLADLATDHRVLAPDNPGFGASDAPPSPYTSSWFAAWLEAFQAATSSRGAVVIGNSLGGRIAIEAGLQHPRSVRALVLLAPSPAFRSLRALVPLVRLLPTPLARLPMVMPPMSHEMAVEGIRAMMSVPERLPQAFYDAAADEAVRVLRSPAHRVAFLSCARQIYIEEAYGRDGFWARLPGLMPPTLFVWGDRDRLVPASFARHVADALPDAGSVVLEDCGHVPHFEHPAETLGLVRGFLAEL
jgi:pimeloyl-ACP methyl ester carboxylesterase